MYEPFPEEIYLKRMERYYDLVSKRLNVDGVLITSRSNYIYLSGFRGSAGYLLITDSVRYLIVDGRYEEEAKRDSRGVEVKLLDWRGSLFQELMDIISKSVPSKLALDSSISHRTFSQFEAELQRRGKEVVPTGDEIWELRRRKDEHELERMRKALALTERFMRETILSLKPGVTELEVVADFMKRSYEVGAKPSFEPIVAFGSGSSMPHYKPGDRALSEGDIVLLDWGNSYGEYCSDITRTVSLRPTDELKRVFQAVYDAQSKAIELAKPGVKVADLDKAAREILERYDLEKYFVHALGHGVGIDVHEPPRVSSSSQEVLQEGDVVTVEPGVYFSGEYGIRLEVMIYIASDGAVLLNSLPQHLEVEKY